MSDDDKKVDVADALEAIFTNVLKVHQAEVKAMTPQAFEAQKAKVVKLQAPHHLHLPHGGKTPEDWSEGKRARTFAAYFLQSGAGSSAWTQDQKLERMLIAHKWVMKAIEAQLADSDPESEVVKKYLETGEITSPNENSSDENDLDEDEQA